MCYFAQTLYDCGDWKWGNLKQRCPRQPRIGEVCGAKLVDADNITKIHDLCKLCHEIKVKQRRAQKEKDNITRWSREGTKFLGLIEKAQRDVKALEEIIAEMITRRPINALRPKDSVQGGPVDPPASRIGAMSVNPYQGTAYTNPSHGSYNSGNISRHSMSASSSPSDNSYYSAYSNPYQTRR